jgi:hypothetical protein
MGANAPGLAQIFVPINWLASGPKMDQSLVGALGFILFEPHTLSQAAYFCLLLLRQSILWSGFIPLEKSSLTYTE